MKKLLLTLVFGLLAHAGLFAQQQVTVQGYVRNSSQVGVSNQAVYILLNQILPVHHFDTVYTDTAGFYQHQYTLPGTNLQGSVLVMTLCGTMDTISGFFSPNISTLNLNLTCFPATPPPTGPGWINGWITPIAAGDTAEIELLALRNGAVVVDTTIYRWDTIQSGLIYYGLRAVAGSYMVRASLTPGSLNYSTRQTTYFGQTTNQSQATTIVMTPGALLNGKNITLLTSTTNPSYFISGIVSGYSPRAAGVDTARVILLEINGNTWTPIDTTYAIDSAGTCFYYFTPANAGTYTVLATLLTGHAANYVPTYYGNATTWSSAYPFSINPIYNQRAANITLQAATATGNGGGNIGGGVFNGLPFVGNGGVHGIPVQLKDGMDNILRVVHTNTDGSFNLSDLPFGTYYLRVEMFGMTSAVSTVVLDAANPSQQGINFTINGSIIATSITEDAIRVKAVYPNPATDRISIGLKATEGAIRTLQLRDLQGRIVLEEAVSLNSGEQVITLELTGIQKGMYLLHVEGASSLVQKVIVQ